MWWDLYRASKHRMKPQCLDPYLSALVNEIVRGFIYGTEVDYCSDIPEFDTQYGPAIIRHTVNLWTGDHPGQCEVMKVQHTGEEACHYWHICGIPLESR